MTEDSTFGAKPERLRRLLLVAREKLEDQAKPTASWDLLAEKPGSEIGRYKLLSVLGEGGMGVVYLAEQEEPIKRRVALKVVKPGMDSKRVIARFEAERQALALLDHPNIAQVYDAGTTDSGRPYFVMEYVQGSPITEYCDQHKLSIEDRLILFRQVCDGVQHAHQKGIIHRDIKPSNILVLVERDKAIGKIIDFGVAKAIAQPLTERTAFTDDTQLLGTPEYMSPEQADMATEDIDTRSDIYSLGVLLYVLLTGVLPFDSATFREGGIERIRKLIRETDPKTPSTRLTKLGEEAKTVAENRRTEIGTLAKHLRRELEWIPLKAMRKERAERYRSASELADDIENYLTGAPLIAGPPGTLYRLKKFVRRHTAAVAAVTAVAVALIAGLIVSTAMYLRAERLRTEAQAVSDFLVRSLLDPKFSDVQEPSLKYVLDRTTERLEGKFADQPLIEASIRSQLGQIYQSIGEFEPARGLLERAYQIELQHLGAEHGHTRNTANRLCWAYWGVGRHDDALRLWTEQIEIIRKAYGEGHGWRLLFMKSIGQTYTYLGRYEEAEAWLDRTLELGKRSSGAYRNFAVKRARLHQGANYLAQGCYEEAEEVLIEALEVARQSWGPEHVNTLKWTMTLSAVYGAQGQYEKAQQLCETTLDAMRQVLGEEHSATLRGMCSLGGILIDRGRFGEAEELLREALKAQRRKLGDEHDDTLGSIHALAVLLTKQEDYDEAETLFDEALKGRQRKRGEGHPVTLETINDFGVLRREQERFGEAQSLLRQALEGRRCKLGDDHPACFESMHELAVLYKVQGKYDDAERLLLEAVEGRRLKLGDEHPHTLESWNNLIELYEAWGKPELAEQWRAKLLHDSTNKK